MIFRGVPRSEGVNRHWCYLSGKYDVIVNFGLIDVHDVRTFARLLRKYLRYSLSRSTSFFVTLVGRGNSTFFVHFHMCVQINCSSGSFFPLVFSLSRRLH